MKEALKLLDRYLSEGLSNESDLSDDEKAFLDKIEKIKIKSLMSQQMRIDDILNVMFEYIQGNYEVKAYETKDKNDLDALALTINILGEELKEKDEQIKEDIREKDYLIKEIHHRIKNNLQVIKSLLSLQLKGMDSVEAHDLAKRSYDRINSIAIVHEMMFGSKDYSKLDFEEYIRELIPSIINNHSSQKKTIILDVQADEILLSLDTSITLGILLSEIVTNSIKYANPESDELNLSIIIEDLGNAEFKAIIGDNGVGFPEGMNYKNTNSLGLQLIQVLAQQLRGKITREKLEKGTNYSLVFNDSRKKTYEQL